MIKSLVLTKQKGFDFKTYKYLRQKLPKTVVGEIKVSMDEDGRVILTEKYGRNNGITLSVKEATNIARFILYAYGEKK